jgi:hypothetical protein
MQIERAYCVELGRVVDIYEAREFYFRQTPPRKRFQFLCSDKKCREANNTQVTGVNYHKLAEESSHSVRPHFRENTKHILDCEWVELEKALTEIEDSGSDSGPKSRTRRRRKGKSPKSSNTVDIFMPSFAGGERVVESVPGGKRGEIVCVPGRRGRTDTRDPHLKDNPNQTSFLENVVHSYLMLKPDETRVTRLKIGRGAWRSYRECFRPIRFYNRDRSENFIYYGGARAQRYGLNFSLTFFDNVKFEGSERQISLYIKKVDLDQYKLRAYISEMLEKLVSKRARYATCYFYGHIRPSVNNAAFLDVSVDHFDNLVLMLK